MKPILLTIVASLLLVVGISQPGDNSRLQVTPSKDNHSARLQAGMASSRGGLSSIDVLCLPFIYSNGGQVASDDGQKLLLNQPAAVEALQQIQDLIYRCQVAPTPSTLQSMPSSSFMLKTGKVAMDITGHWKILDLNQMGFDWGMGVLPLF